VRSCGRCEGRRREPRAPAASTRPGEAPGQLLVDGVTVRRRNDSGGARLGLGRRDAVARWRLGFWVGAPGWRWRLK
jgi:hypothetical protein